MRRSPGDVARRFRRNPLRFEIPGLENVVKITDGGFSALYRADQPQFGRRVAVKMLASRGVNKRDLFRRFERERKTLGMLGDHPHVVRVFHAGIGKSGCPYIVMEYLPAGSLADWLDAAGALPWEEVLAIGVKLAGALQSAHQAGVLHLDIKPANVLVGPNGEPKLADFGIARLRAAAGVTTTQVLALTVGYAAPELFEEDEPTAAADVYSLGVTLFALLTGHSPFLRSPNEEPRPEVIIGRMLFRKEVPALGPGFPADLRAVMRQAMAKKAGDRFSSAAELGGALQEVQRGHELPITPLIVVDVPKSLQKPQPRPAGYRRHAIVSALLVLLLVAGVVGVAAWPDTACSEPNTVKADGVLSFGTVLPKTGQFVYHGPALQAGVQLAINDINAAGGIPGVNVHLDEANKRDSGDGTSTNTAWESTDALLSAGVDVIIGAATSAVTLEVIDKVVCAGVIMFAASNTAAVFSTYPDHGLYFRTSRLSIHESSVLGKLVVADGNSTAVVMSRDDVYANGLRKETAKAIEDFGGTVLDSFSYDPGAPNRDSDIQRVKAKNPDAIVLIGFTESAEILAEMIEQALGPRNKRVYGAVGNMSNTLARQVNPRDPGVLAGMRGAQLDVGGEAFSNRLKEAKPGLQDLTYAPHVYDAVVVTALAAAIAGTDAPAAVAEQINGVTKGGQKCADFSGCMGLITAGKDIDYDGVSGPLEFADPGEPSSGAYVISEFQADGSLKPIRSEEVSLPLRRGPGGAVRLPHSNVIHHLEGEARA